MCDDYFARRSALGKPPLKHQLVAYTVAGNVIGVYKYTGACIRQSIDTRHSDIVTRVITTPRAFIVSPATVPPRSLHVAFIHHTSGSYNDNPRSRSAVVTKVSSRSLRKLRNDDFRRISNRGLCPLHSSPNASPRFFENADRHNN